PAVTDPVMANNTASAVVHATAAPLPQADLRITKTHAAPYFLVGSDGTYRITVSNHGPDAAAGPIVVTDTLPAGLRFVSASGSAWRCDAAHAVATCRRAEALGAGRSSTFSVTVHVLKAAFPGATNRASVSSGTSDPDPT